jgi:hypothetical protein
MELTAEERVKITSSASFFEACFAVKSESNASGLESGGTVVETEIGRCMEKKDAM